MLFDLPASTFFAFFSRSLALRVHIQCLSAFLGKDCALFFSPFELFHQKEAISSPFLLLKLY